MKITQIGLAALLGTLVSTSAIERPKGGDSPKEIPTLPAEPQGGVLEGSEKPAEKAAAKIAFLGVGGIEASDALKHQLELESGLLLTQVAPKSPAGMVGLAEHDIIVSVEGMPLTDQDSLRKSLSNFKPGDEVTLKLVRRGKIIEQDVALCECEALPNAQALIPGQARDLNQLLRDHLGKQLGGFDNEQLRNQLLQEMERAFGQNGGKDLLEFKLDLNGGNFQNGDDKQLGFKGFGKMRFQDNEGSIEMNQSEGQRELSIRDADGKLLFSGPYDNEIDKEALPEEYRERVERFLGSEGRGGFRLKMKEMMPRAKEGKKAE
ncbi:PDZ domain-containing protein [Verrucomicrobiaceae bacterium 227]